MTDERAGWDEVRERLNELGLKLQLHYEQAGGEGHDEDTDKIKEALRTIGDAVEQAFGALGTVVKDDAVRDDVKDVGRSLLDALDATFSELGDRFRSAVKR